MRIFLTLLFTLLMLGCDSQKSKDAQELSSPDLKSPALEKEAQNVASSELKEEVILTKIELPVSNPIYQRCASCHGERGEKSAMNQSQIIAGWNADRIAYALYGYKDGSYGKALKGLMKAQVNHLSDDDIRSVANFIATLK